MSSAARHDAIAAQQPPSDLQQCRESRRRAFEDASDALLRRLGEAWKRNRSRVETVSGEGQRFQALCEKLKILEIRIAATPAYSLRALRMKAEIADALGDEADEDLAKGIIADLLRLTAPGEAAA